MKRRNFLQLLPSVLVALLPMLQDDKPGLDIPQHSDIDTEELARAIWDTPLIGPETISEVGLWSTPVDVKLDTDYPSQEEVRKFVFHDGTHNHDGTINDWRKSQGLEPYSSHNHII